MKADEAINPIDETHEAVLELSRRRGLDGINAAQLAQDVCARLQERLGGRRHWWSAPDTTARDASIVHDCVELHLKQTEVAVKHNVSVRTVEYVVQRAKRFSSQDVGLHVIETDDPYM